MPNKCKIIIETFIDIEDVDKEQEAGSTAVLTCIVYGSDSATLTWSTGASALVNDGSPYSISETTSNLDDTTTSVLTVAAGGTASDITFTCAASSTGYSSTVQTDVFLRVYSK